MTMNDPRGDMDARDRMNPDRRRVVNERPGWVTPAIIGALLLAGVLAFAASGNRDRTATTPAPETTGRTSVLLSRRQRRCLPTPTRPRRKPHQTCRGRSKSDGRTNWRPRLRRGLLSFGPAGRRRTETETAAWPPNWVFSGLPGHALINAQIGGRFRSKADFRATIAKSADEPQQSCAAEAFRSALCGMAPFRSAPFPVLMA